MKKAILKNTKNSKNYSKELATAKKIAIKAGDIILKYFDTDQQIKIKSDKSLVTIADTSVNELVIKELLKVFPNDGIIGEERSISEYGMGRLWFCDPIDGTAGYVWGVPTAMFSLALVVDGKAVVGVAYDPFLKRMYYAVHGKGSFCNGKRLKVSDKKLSEGIFAVSGSVPLIQKLSYIPALKEQGTRFATYSGAVHKSCLVAKGKFVGYVEYGVNPHDMAAVQVIVEEAGGKVTSLTGEKLDYSKPFRSAIASNGKAHAKLVEAIATVDIVIPGRR